MLKQKFEICTDVLRALARDPGGYLPEPTFVSECYKRGWNKELWGKPNKFALEHPEYYECWKKNDTERFLRIKESSQSK